MSDYAEGVHEAKVASPRSVQKECELSQTEIDGETVFYYQDSKGQIVFVPEWEIKEHKMNLTRTVKEDQDLAVTNDYDFELVPTAKSAKDKELLKKHFGKIRDISEEVLPKVTLRLANPNAKAIEAKPLLIQFNSWYVKLSPEEFELAVRNRKLAGNLDVRFENVCGPKTSVRRPIGVPSDKNLETVLIDEEKKFVPYDEAKAKSLAEMVENFKGTDSEGTRALALGRIYDIYLENLDETTLKLMSLWGLSKKDLESLVQSAMQETISGKKDIFPFDPQTRFVSFPKFASSFHEYINSKMYQESFKPFNGYIDTTKKEVKAITEKYHQGFEILSRAPSKGILTRTLKQAVDKNHQRTSFDLDYSFQPVR